GLRIFSRHMIAGKSGRACLAEPRLLQHAIGLQHIAEPVFRTSVATIGIGMVALSKLLISRLDIGASSLCIKSKRFRGPGLRRPGFSFARLGGSIATSEKIAGVAHRPVVAGWAGALVGKIRRKARCALPATSPGWPVARQRLLLEAGHVAVGKARE